MTMQVEYGVQLYGTSLVAGVLFGLQNNYIIVQTTIFFVRKKNMLWYPIIALQNILGNFWSLHNFTSLYVVSWG